MIAAQSIRQDDAILPDDQTDNQVSRKQGRMSNHTIKGYYEIVIFLPRFLSFGLRTWHINPSKDHQVCYFNLASVSKRKSMTTWTVCATHTVD